MVYCWADTFVSVLVKGPTKPRSYHRTATLLRVINIYKKREKEETSEEYEGF